MIYPHGMAIALERMGYWDCQLKPVDGGEELVYWAHDDPIPDVSAAQAIQAVRDYNDDLAYALHKARMDGLVAKYPYAETLDWRDLEHDARQYQDDGTVGKQLQRFVDRGYDPVEYSARVITKADILDAAKMDLIAARDQVRQEAAAAPDPFAFDVASRFHELLIG